MKHIATIICAAVLLLGATACAQNRKENKEMKKTLVAYFSATGTTKAAAERLAKEMNADLYEIAPEVPYTSADLDWRDKQSRSTKEMQDKTSRPAIKGTCTNIDDYDTVWIGFPVWWYTAPTIVNTFIEAHDLSGKVLNVFATSGGSGVDGSAKDLKKAYPQYTWGESRLMN
ncbi:MAG: NAD(P)H-dependent oxidoreductase [Bacteroidales bacterium]|nr:NAD(P)H-dependent oxidoreductase [Bacteroidales bacterium]